MCARVELIPSLKGNVRDVSTLPITVLNDVNTFYEWTYPNKIIKPFVDIDGKRFTAYNHMSSEKDAAVSKKNRQIIEALNTIDGAMVLSSTDPRWDDGEGNQVKFSFRVTFSKYKVKNKDENKRFAREVAFPEIEKKLRGIMEVCDSPKENALDIDFSVYRGGSGGKMRTVNSRKPGGKPHLMKSGNDVEPYLLHVLSGDEIYYDFPTQTSDSPKQAKKKKLKINKKANEKDKDQIEEPETNELKEIGDNISLKFLDNYNDWIKIVWSLQTEGYKTLARYLSAKSHKFEFAAFDKIYQSSKGFVKMGTFFDYSRKSDPVNYQQIREKYREYKNVKKFQFEDVYEPIKILSPPLYLLKFRDGSLKFYSETNLVTAFLHIKYRGINAKTGVSETRTFIKTWLSTDKPPVVKECIVNEPECKNKNVFNLWKGFYGDVLLEKYTADDVDAKAVEYFRHHIRVMCCNSEIIAEQFEDWLAHMFQYPKIKSYIPIFIGGQGTGKGMLIEFIRKLMGGKMVLETSKPERDVWGQFNSLMKDSFLVHLCEFDRKNSMGYEKEIKNLTTDGEITINQKGKDAIVFPSYHRFIGSTNKNDPITLEDDNRRYVLIMNSNEKKGDDRYFKKGWDMTKNEKQLFSIFKFIKERKVQQHLNFNELVQSEFQKHVMEYTDPIEIKWFKKFISKNIKKEIVVPCDVDAKDLYLSFREYVQDNEYRFEKSQASFSKNLLAYLIKNNIKNCKKRHNNGRNGVVFQFSDFKTLGKELGIGCLLNIT